MTVQRTSRQNPWHRSPLSDAQLVRAIQAHRAELVEADALFADYCSLEILENGELSRLARDRLMRIGKAAGIVGQKKACTHPQTSSYRQTLAEGCSGYRELLVSAQEALHRRPTLPHKEER